MVLHTCMHIHTRPRGSNQPPFCNSAWPRLLSQSTCEPRNHIPTCTVVMPSASCIRENNTGWRSNTKKNTGDGTSSAATPETKPNNAKSVTFELPTQTSPATASEPWPHGHYLECYRSPNERAAWFSCRRTGKAVEPAEEPGWEKKSERWMHHEDTNRWFFVAKAHPGKPKSVETRNTTPAVTGAKPPKEVITHNMAENDDTAESASHSLEILYEQADWTTASGLEAWPRGQTLRPYTYLETSATWFWCPLTEKVVEPMKEHGWK